VLMCPQRQDQQMAIISGKAQQIRGLFVRHIQMMENSIN